MNASLLCKDWGDLHSDGIVSWFADPMQLHWIKYGGAVMRIGAQSPYLIRYPCFCALQTALTWCQSIGRSF